MDALHRSVCVCFAFIQLCKEIPYDIRNNEKDKKHTVTIMLALALASCGTYKLYDRPQLAFSVV